MDTMKKAIVYARVSTPGQAEQGVSLPSQIESGQKRAAQLEAEVVKEFIDDGISGRTSARPAFLAAVDYCALHAIDYFITWSTSRFARNRIDAAAYKQLLRKRGTKIVYISTDIDGESDDGWLLEGLFELMDEQYSRTLSKDTRGHMLRNARDGYFNGGTVAYGYRSTPEGNRRRLTVHPEEAAIVREMFNRCANGAGSKSIALALNAAGRLRRGQPWNKDLVLDMLKNWVYAGYVTFGRHDRTNKCLRPESEWIRRKSHEPIITEETFVEVQNKFAERAPRTLGGSPLSRFLFTGILRCGACGTRMQIEKATGRSRAYSYYNCHGAQRGTGCANRRLPANELDQWLMGVILDKILSRERIAAIIQQIYELKGQFARDRDTKRAALVADLRNNEARRSRLYEVLELHGKDAPNLADIGPRLAGHNERIRAIERELTVLENLAAPQAPISDREIQDIGEYLRRLLQETGDPEKIREFLGSFIDRAVLANEQVTIHYNQAKLVSSGGAVHSEGCVHPTYLAAMNRQLVAMLPERFRKAA
jgi:DNA invertase Pin-like site-specific DNA recombinase